MSEYDDQIREHYADDPENADGLIAAIDSGEVETAEALGVYASALVNGDESGLEEDDFAPYRSLGDRYGQPTECIPIGWGTCETSGLVGDISLYIFPAS